MKNLVHSIAFKSVAILLVSSGLLASIVSFLGDKAGREIAVRGVVAVAETQTLGLAEHLVGPLRFKRLEDVDATVKDAMARSDLSLGALVITQDGVVANSEGFLEEDAEVLQNLAQTAMETGTFARSDGGLYLAVPIRKSENDPVVGAVATSWTSAPFMTTIADYRRLQLIGAATALAGLVAMSAFFIRWMVSAPIRRVEARASVMAEGDLASEIPGLGRRGEIGSLAASMERLRSNLRDAEVAAAAAFYESAGFQASSAAQILCDDKFTIESHNAEFERFQKDMGFAETNLIGERTDVFRIPCLNSETLASTEFPLQQEFSLDGKMIAVSIKAVIHEGISKGYVIEWQDVTEQRIDNNILHALEESWLRVDFNADGAFLSATDVASKVLGSETSLNTSIECKDGRSGFEAVRGGKAYFGRLFVKSANDHRILDGSISPIKNTEGKLVRFVLLGSDITEAEAALENARRKAEEMSATQTRVVTHLQQAMQSLSQGDLTMRIEEAFADDYEALRSDLNNTVSSLDQAISEVLSSAEHIFLDMEGVARGVEEVASRAETQAAALEETSAAISQLTNSISTTASDATDARDIVLSARGKAESSIDVVQKSVAAMSEIEDGSKKISQIIGVIDEIAFQTNLLALNAGVEAARAGEAGRGFAVVASEVRDLAQRSADAAREISALIHSSEEHVNVGVSLVGNAGSALEDIAKTIVLAAEKVETIAVSAEQQASGIKEINQAMHTLDQVTQQNATTFEETSASTKAMQIQTKTLENATSGFQTSETNKNRSHVAQAGEYKAAS